MDKKNFYLPNNENRYVEYLYQYLFKYLTKYNIFDHVYQVKLDDDYKFAGVYVSSNGVSCIIPKRNNLYDEMICIHELTHLINVISSSKNNNSKYDEIIPYFNEYHYLKLINDDLAFAFEDFRYCELSKIDSQKDNFTNHLYAYSTLVRRKNDYNINELNKINSSDVELQKELKLKGYIK